MVNNENFEINEVIAVSYKNSEVFMGTLKKKYDLNKKTVYYGELPVKVNNFNGTIYAFGETVDHLKMKLNETLGLIIKNEIQNIVKKSNNNKKTATLN